MRSGSLSSLEPVMINRGSVFLTMNGILALESAFVKAFGSAQADSCPWRGGEMLDEPAGEHVGFR
jgi:hypothetical protein